LARKTFKKIITSEEISEKILPKNRNLINKYIKEKDRKCSDKTILNYASDVEIFFTWNYLYNDNKYFPEIKKREMADFFNYCVSDLKWGGARFGRMRSSVSGMADFIVKYYDEEFPTYRNFIKNTIEPISKVAVRKKTILSKEQVDSLLTWLVETNKKQEACFLSLAINSGCRISELIQFKIDSIDKTRVVHSDLFLKTTNEIRTKGKGKVGNLLYKYVMKCPFIPYYDSWIDERTNFFNNVKKESDYLFINTLGKPATVQTVNSWVANWEKYLKSDVYMHSFRHYFVTQLTRIGLTPAFIVEIMGWKTDAMYKIYNDLTGEDRPWEDVDILKKYLENDDDE
jgi:site-specific recombinase XerD